MLFARIEEVKKPREGELLGDGKETGARTRYGLEAEDNLQGIRDMRTDQLV